MAQTGTWLASMNWVWVLFASCFAMASGTFLGRALYAIVKKRDAATRFLASNPQERIYVRMRGGIRCLRPASRYLLERVPVLADAAESAQILLDEHGLSFAEEALMSLLLGSSLASLALGAIISRSVVFGVAIACVVFIGTVAYVRNQSEKKSLAMREEIPEALRSLGMSFRSGHSLPQTLSDCAEETDGYLGHLFKVAADRLEMGATPSEALSVMRNNPRVPELSFLAVALDVQHQSGGSIAPVLESATESVEGELRLMRSLRVQTAQAKLSASIVTIMPFILVAMFSLMSPGFLAPFFTSFLGMALLALALAMQISGILLVRRMLKVEAG